MGLSPTYEQLEMFYMTDETKPPLSVLLDRFALYASIDNFFFLCDYTSILFLFIVILIVTKRGNPNNKTTKRREDERDLKIAVFNVPVFLFFYCSRLLFG